jgi:hypothetical protein
VCKGVPGAAIALVCFECASREAYCSAALKSCLRLSSLGRNFNGVWYTFGAEDGGLNTSVGAEVFEV